MQFVNAMDNLGNRKTIPSKEGTMVRVTVGHSRQDKLLELWNMLKRGTDSSEIATRVDAIVRSAAPNKGTTAERKELLILLCRLIIQKRDCRTAVVRKMLFLMLSWRFAKRFQKQQWLSFIFCRRSATLKT